MKKIDKIKQYFIDNNITEFSGAYGNFPDGPGARYTFTFWKDIQDIDTFSETFIVCLKKENSSYLIDFLSPKRRYQKIGDFEKGESLAKELSIYFSSWRYTNFPDNFMDPYKQVYTEEGRENIKKYIKFWQEKLEKDPDNEEIKERLNNIKIKYNTVPYVETGLNSGTSGISG